MKNRLERFRAFIAAQTGIVLEADRDYMVDTRLLPVMRANKITSLDILLDQAMAGTNPSLTQSVIEAMLTCETFFFRDRPVFQVFREEILPEMIEARQSTRCLRIWCAAASTGQEPYSLAMILDENAAALKGWQVEIIATDISSMALETARSGLYNQFEVQRGLPVALLLRYFVREQERWRIAEHLRSRVEFKQLNLKQDFKSMGEFDIIFCRNVLMYFDPDTKRHILGRMSQSVADGGWLILGATENTSGLAKELAPDLRVPAGYRPRHHALASSRIVSRMSVRV